MPRYSPERKEAILKKLLPSLNMTVADVSQQESIAFQTLYNWRKQIRSEGKPMPGKQKRQSNGQASQSWPLLLKQPCRWHAKLTHLSG